MADITGSKPSWIQGKDTDDITTSAFLAGQVIGNTATPVFLAGQSRFQHAWIRGKNTDNIAIPAFLAGESRFQHAMVMGGTVATDFTVAYISGYSTPSTAIQNEAKGYPCLLFSARPYTAFNFQVSGKFQRVGIYSWVGLVGLAEDAGNYIVARAKYDRIQICKTRYGRTTVLAEVMQAVGEYVYLYFSHKDGDFEVRMLTEDREYLDPILTYRWKYTDGPIATDQDLFHVGVYSFIDPPHFRTTSFDLVLSEGIPIIPGTDLAGFDLMPSSGVIDIEGEKFNYTSKTARGITQRGAYQMLNVGSDAGGRYAEITYFDNSGASVSRYNNYLLASNQLYNWKIRNTQYIVHHHVSGHTVYLYERARIYCARALGDVSTTDKAWITDGLLGITLNSGSPTSHPMNTLVFLDSNDRTVVFEFNGSSGHTDATIGDMLEMVSRMAGASPIFPGDRLSGPYTLSGTGVAV